MGGKVLVKGCKKKKWKKKGRHDLRSLCQEPSSDRHRRHRVSDGNDDDDDEEEEEKRREKKKVKLLLRLPSSYRDQEEECPCSNVVVADQTGARFSQEPDLDDDDDDDDASSVSSLEEFDDVHKPLKKRKLGDHDSRPQGSSHEEEKKISISKRKDHEPGIVTDSAAVTPLPDIKLLEILLDKLQKKDTYGVFAEPVDPNELPDYHDVIENPMDFSTIRKKLTSAVYSTLEHLEKDVFLVCANAMRYNSPETIYFRQAHSIQELAEKRFQKLRVDREGIEIESKSAQKAAGPDSFTKTTLEISLGKPTQEPVGSDFSSGATVAMARDTCAWSNTGQASAFEKPVNMISFGDGSSFMDEIGSDKEDEVSAKGLLSKLGRKPFMLDENRRLTYNISDQLVGGSESLFSIFECETKQLISVGLHAEHSYTRSLARFAAALGPVAWRVASQRIKQALPGGFLFGPGWVGEYESLPRPIHLELDGIQISKEAAYRTTMRPVAQSKGDTPSKKRASRVLGPPMEGCSGGTSSEGKSGLLGVLAGTRPIPNSLFVQQNSSPAISVVNSDKNTLGGSSSKFRSHMGSTLPSQGLNKVETSCSPTVGSKGIEDSLGQLKYCSEVPTSSLLEMVSRNSSRLVPSGSGNHSVDKEDGAVVGRLADGKIISNTDGSSVRISVSDFVSSQLACANHEQDPIDQARLMRMLSGKVIPNQPKALSASAVYNSIDQSSKRGDSHVNAADRSWMSMRNGEPAVSEGSGLHRIQTAAASLYNPAWEFSKEVFVPSLGLQSENRFGSQILPQTAHVVVGKESQLQNQSMIFPQLAVTDLSRVHGHSPWQGLGPQINRRQKTDNFPPDLNISFQLPGSPVQHSPGMLADSQQPDLALQL